LDFTRFDIIITVDYSMIQLIHFGNHAIFGYVEQL